MRPGILFRYITWRTMTAAGALFAILASLIFLIDLIESLRFAGKVEAGFAFALRLTLMRTPGLAQALAPFIFLFGAIWMFTQLNRRSEISVMRSAGLSVWRLIGPAALVAGVAGVLIVAIVDPLSARMMAFGEQMKNDIRGKRSNVVRLFEDGLWLRQRAPNSILILNAKSFDEANDQLSGVTVWRLDERASLLERVDAPQASLSEQQLSLRDAQVTATGERLNHRAPIYKIETNLSSADLRERVTPPESISLWDLPRFIELAEAAGLPTVRYHIRFHDLCSMPLKLVAMVLIAGLFSLKPMRTGGAFRLLLSSIVAGFLLYMISEISTALGEAGSAPVALAAWTPALVATMIAIAGLLQFEDG